MCTTIPLLVVGVIPLHSYFYAVTKILCITLHANESVKGVATADVGIMKDGAPKKIFQQGMELQAKCTIFAEVCRGHLSNFVMEKDLQSHGGSFMYHIEDNGQPLVSLGLIIGLDYKNPHTNLYQTSLFHKMNEDLEFQLFKSHLSILHYLEGGERITYDARTVNEGGYQTVPQLTVPGGCLVGCAAGLMNPAKIKGVHNAMKNGMIAAEAIFEDLGPHTRTVIPEDFKPELYKSYIIKEMRRMRNVRPSFRSRFGWIVGLPYTAFFYMLLRGNEPWTFKNKTEDWFQTDSAWKSTSINYPKPVGKVTFDILSSVALTGTNHEENPHLLWRNDADAELTTWRRFAGMTERFCPAGVYEYVPCETKWVAPEGGNGSKYNGM
ncbi:Electron transfer flavoprotein-ubiquinone oxidoreductase family protein [Brugia pahangi]